MRPTQLATPPTPATSVHQRGYDTNLASEFYVLSILYRLGLDANVTLGNKKSVDISVVLGPGRAVTIDVKAVAGNSISRTSHPRIRTCTNDANSLR
jgi:hypothetical protein